MKSLSNETIECGKPVASCSTKCWQPNLLMNSYIFKTNFLKLDTKFVFKTVKNKMKYMQMLLFSFWGK
jgi:hypothetical protein